MSRMKLWNGTQWVMLDANDANTLGGKNASDFAPVTHLGSGGNQHALATTSIAGFMSPADKTKLDNLDAGTDVTSSGTNGNILVDGVETVVYTHPANHPASIIIEDSTHRFTTDAEKTTWNAKASTSVVTTSVNGLMSSSDKTKLDGVATGANNYVHPTTDGNLHVPATSTTNNGKYLKAGATAGSIAWNNIVAADITQDSSNRFTTDAEKTTWNAKASTSVVTTSVNGLMIASDKAKLDGIATGATNYVHPTGDGNSHVPANGTTNNGKFLSATATAGVYQWANILATNITQDSSNRFVTDAEKTTWNAKASTTAVTTSANGLMSAADKTKLDGIATGATNYAHPTGDGNLHVPATGTTSNGKVLTAGATAGSLSWVSMDFSSLANIPTTIAGYGITDANVASNVYAGTSAPANPPTGLIWIDTN